MGLVATWYKKYDIYYILGTSLVRFVGISTQYFENVFETCLKQKKESTKPW
jgi:hypothetical protein